MWSGRGYHVLGDFFLIKRAHLESGMWNVAKENIVFDCFTLALNIDANPITQFLILRQSFCGNFRTWIRLRRLA